MKTPLHAFTVTLKDPAPPSANNLYVTGYHGKRVLSAEGRAFKDALTAAVVAECMQHSWKDAIHAVYGEAAWVRLRIYLHTEIFNGSWTPKGRTRKGEARSPYKKMDGSNYIKAIEDAVKEGTGIDDSAHLTVTVIKRNYEGPRFVEVRYAVFPGLR